MTRIFLFFCLYAYALQVSAHEGHAPLASDLMHALWHDGAGAMIAIGLAALVAVVLGGVTRCLRRQQSGRTK